MAAGHGAKRATQPDPAKSSQARRLARAQAPAAPAPPTDDAIDSEPTVRNPRERFSWPDAQFAINEVTDIIDPAAELFAERGYQNTTMDDLAHRIGVAKPTLYAYVGSKARILEAIYDHFLKFGERSLEEAASQPTALEQLRSVLRSWTWASVEMRSYYTVYFNQTVSLEPEARANVRALASKMMRTIHGFVIDGQRRDEIAADVDPTFVTFSVIALATWSGQWLPPGSGLNWREAADQAYYLLERGIVRAPQGTEGCG